MDWLLFAADREAASLLDDAARAHAEGRPARPDEWTAQTRSAVRAEVERLVSGWDDEPVAVRFALAALAGLFPDRAEGLQVKIVDLAAMVEGTSHAAVLRRGADLMEGADGAAADAARESAAWLDPLPDGIDSVDAPTAVVASHVLAVGAAQMLR